MVTLLAEHTEDSSNIADIERNGISHVLRAEASGDLRGRHPYVYAAAEDLHIADVAPLLAAYKQLVSLSPALQSPSHHSLPSLSRALSASHFLGEAGQSVASLLANTPCHTIVKHLQRGFLCHAN